MKLSLNQKSWLISFILHFIVIVLLTDFFGEEVIEKKQQIQPIEVKLYQPPQPKVKTKKQISKKGRSKPAKKTKPTSLPGDRKQPETSQSVAPTYPKKAMNNEWEGTVKVKVTVSPTGKPIKIKIVSSSGHESLDNAFIRSIKNGYQFKPKRVMGKNVVGIVALSYKFSMESQ